MPYSSSDKKTLAKEPGLKTFKASDGFTNAGPSSEDVATSFLNTEKSLRDKIQKELSSGGSNVTKIENDLTDFYRAMENKYSHPIRERKDFLDLVDALKSQDDRIAEASDKMKEFNSNNILSNKESSVKGGSEDLRSLFEVKAGGEVSTLNSGTAGEKVHQAKLDYRGKDKSWRDKTKDKYSIDQSGKLAKKSAPDVEVDPARLDDIDEDSVEQEVQY